MHRPVCFPGREPQGSEAQEPQGNKSDRSPGKSLNPGPEQVVASALSFRYEFSKQWKAHALRLLLDLPLNAYRRSSALRAGEPANDIVDVCSTSKGGAG